MMIAYRTIFFISIFLHSILYAGDSNISTKYTANIKDKNITFVKLLKVNDHIITSDVLGPKKVHAFIYKFKKPEREIILNQLINDEIAVEYTYKYMKLEDNLTSEKQRLNLGLANIQNIALKESSKTISDKNASSFYKKHKQDYWHEKHYEASHIMIGDKNKSIQIVNDLAKAKDLRSTFKKLAKEFSEDRSSEKGGYLGHFESKVMVKPFREALEKLQVGKYTTTPVKTRFGYHIILLHGIVPKGYIPLDKVKNDIKMRLGSAGVNKWYEETLLPLKKKAKIEYLFDLNRAY